MKHELPKLPYAYDALEPYLDARTMEVHHTKHHQAYVDRLNGVLKKYPTLQDVTAEDLLLNLPTLDMDEADRVLVKNYGGGHVNHSFFWNIMGPMKEVDQKLVQDITKQFGSVDEFKKLFNQAAVGHFGSGWVWLVRDERKALRLYSLPNQDSPLLSGHTPLITLDLWEHAYYLKYQNRRAEYVENWWNVLKLF